MRREPEHWGEPHSRVPWRLLGAVVGMVALLTLGFVIPLAQGDGVERLPPERRAAGRFVVDHASLGCMDNPIQRGLTAVARIAWLHPTWQPGETPTRSWRPQVVARLRTHTLFGLPAGDVTVFSGGGSACWDVDVEREYSLAVALERSRDEGTARFFIRLPDDVFRPVGVVGRIDFRAGRSVVDRAPPAEYEALPTWDAAALFAAVEREAASWTYLGEGENGTRFGVRDPFLAAAVDRPWVVVAASVEDGYLRAVEYVLPGIATMRPAVVRFFDYGEAEPLDRPAGLLS